MRGCEINRFARLKVHERAERSTEWCEVVGSDLMFLRAGCYFANRMSAWPATTRLPFSSITLPS
jgi:hypothetical protein